MYCDNQLRFLFLLESILVVCLCPFCLSYLIYWHSVFIVLLYNHFYTSVVMSLLSFMINNLSLPSFFLFSLIYFFIFSNNQLLVLLTLLFSKLDFSYFQPSIYYCLPSACLDFSLSFFYFLKRKIRLLT